MKILGPRLAHWWDRGGPLVAPWLADVLLPHLTPGILALLERLMKLRDALNALNVSTASLKSATDAEAQANTALATAQADAQAKTAAFAASLKAAPGGSAVDTTTPNADGTLNEYVADGSALGYHVETITTLDTDLPAPTVQTTPPAQ